MLQSPLSVLHHAKSARPVRRKCPRGPHFEAMGLAELAWREVSQQTIFNCWKKTDILADTLLTEQSSSDAPRERLSSLSSLTSLPESDHSGIGHTLKTSTPPTGDSTADDVQHAEQEVESLLSQLQATGVLRAVNCMNLQELLDIPEEQAKINNATDQEIFEAVTEQRAQELREIEGGDDENDSAIPKPSRRQALEAASVLRGYVADRVR
jgi:hypothetical protein